MALKVGDPRLGLQALGAALITLGVCISIPAQDLPEPPSTFSILGYDPETGEVGGAVQSRVFSVGNGVLWAEADTGIVTTQAIVDELWTERAGAAAGGHETGRDHPRDSRQRS